MVGKGRFTYPAVPNIPKTFPVTELSTSFKLRLKLIKIKHLVSQSHWLHFKFSVVTYG